MSIRMRTLELTSVQGGAMATKDHQSEPIESASETLQRIFDGHGSVLGSQMADESSRYDVLKKTDFPKPQRTDRKSTRLNSSHIPLSRMPSSA